MYFNTQTPSINEVSEFISTILTSMPDMDKDTRHAFVSNALEYFFGEDLMHNYLDDSVTINDSDDEFDDSDDEEGL